ncbi:MAG: HU family DNA-binding protein [Janthinobacterium lividum]
MATKKAVAKKTAVPAKKTVAKKSAPTKALAGAKAPVQKMSKTQVIRYMAERTELPIGQCAAFLAGLVELATTETRKNGEFTIPGLGKLVKAQRAARIGRNPATGEAIKIGAKTTVKFRLAKAAKDAVVPPKA